MSDVPRRYRAARATQTNGSPPRADQDRGPTTQDHQPEIPEPMSIGEMIRRYPTMRPVAIDGLLRRGETANIIAPPKVGKSWLAYGLTLSVATGKLWLGRFPCTKGRVLLIDNELHPETITQRIQVVADAMAIKLEAYQDLIDVVSLRGRLTDLYRLRGIIDRIERGQYRLIIGDAWYRFIPAGISENHNTQVMGLYNVLDEYMGIADAAWVGIHHASKGNQSEKSVTDIGAGAGSQSRAADSHIVLRPHQEENVVVLDAALRSFAPVEPVPLRWSFPLWTPDEGLDPTALKGRKAGQDEEQQARDSEIDMEVLRLAVTWKSRNELKRELGVGDTRIDRALHRLVSGGYLDRQTEMRRGQEARIYRKTLRAA